MDDNWKTIIWGQFGASIDMLENAIRDCPEDVWGNHAGYHEFWYVAYHTLFFLDYYLSDSSDSFTPPFPYTLSELDPSGVLPERVYTKEELLCYIAHCREKCRTTLNALSDEKAHERCGFDSPALKVAELFLYNMRHVQHHAAQLNLLLRQRTDSAPRWVAKTKNNFRGK